MIAQHRTLLAVMQPLAAHLVSAVLLLSTTLVSRSIPALAAPAEPSSTAHVEPVDDSSGDKTPSRLTAHTRYEVKRRDTLWGIAERELGDGHRWREIRALNVGRPQPGGATLRPGSTMIDVGWTLLLPTTTDRDRDDAPDSRADDVVTVERGDTLSEIAADHLGSAGQWPALYRHNRGREQPDGRRLRDPDLIYPGWRIDVDLDTDGRDRTRPHRNGSQQRGGQAASEERTDTPTEDGGRPDQGASLPAADALQHPDPAAPNRPAPVDGAARDDARVTDATAEHSDRAWMWWAAGGLMSAGVLATLVRQQRIWRRRRRVGDLQPQFNQPAPVHPSGTDELRVRAAMAVGAFAGAYEVMPRIAGVTIGPAGDIALLLEDAAPDELPDGWLRDAADSRVAIVPAAIDEAELEERAAIASSAAAGLVTLGVGARTGQLVLLALDSCGGVSLSGPADVVEATMLAWALELATSEFAGALDVWLVGFALAPDTTSEWERIHAVDSVPEAVGGIRRQAIGTDENQVLAPAR